MKKEDPPKIDTKQLMSAIGTNIRNHRQRAGVTQEQLAESANINEKFLSAVENKKVDNLSIGYLLAVSDALDIQLIELLKDH